MDKKRFYDTIRPHMNLTTQNVIGMEKVLDYGIARASQVDDLSYIIATTWWETGQTMHPVREGFYIAPNNFKKAEAWRKKNLRYYPWYGRGLIQTTWEDNYRRIAKAMGLPEDTFIKNPDLLLEWEYALPALFVGMEMGIYTGKDLDDYLDNVDENDAEDLREYMNARRIVNGTDKAATIGKLALTVEKGLRAAGYAGVPVPTPKPQPTPEPSPAPQPVPRPVEDPDEKEVPIWANLVLVVVVIGGVVAYLLLS